MNTILSHILAACMAFFALHGSAVQAQTTGTTSGGFAWSSTGTAVAITGYTGSGGPVSIPAAINSLPVRSIASGAFKNNTSLISVTVPGTITSIGSGAFSGCSSLATAVFQGNAPAMGTGAFGSVAGNFTVYFWNGITGFTAPTWGGYPAVARIHDLQGYWNVTEKATLTESQDGVSQTIHPSASGIRFISQTGSSFSFYSSSILRTGTISGNTITAHGIGAILIANATVIANSFDMVGTISPDGSTISATTTENVVAQAAGHTESVTGNGTAVFALSQLQNGPFSISTSAAPAAGGNTVGDGTFSSGSVATVGVTPSAGYDFVNWMEGGNQLSASPSYHFIANGSRTLTANFVPSSADNYLAALVPGKGVLLPAFARNTQTYTATLPKSTPSYTVTPSALAASGATITVSAPTLNGGTPVTVASGAASPGIPLIKGGSVAVTVTVTAPDNSTSQSYQIKVSATSVLNDFNGDGQTDILWEDTAHGAHVIWDMNGASQIGSANIGVLPTHWRIATTGDFNGDGQTDIIWEDTTSGTRIIWFMNGAKQIGSASLGVIPTHWRIAASGDFNGDGNPDILWEDTTSGTRIIWFMNGGKQIGSANLGVIPAHWRIAATGDFNGDGQADIIWEDTTSGTRIIWFMNGATQIGSANLGVIPTNWRIAATGDFNGDGQTDIVWQDNNSGVRLIWLMNGVKQIGTVNLGTIPTNWQIRN